MNFGVTESLNTLNTMTNLIKKIYRYVIREIRYRKKLREIKKRDPFIY